MSERRRVQITFRKGEGARYLSHLDLMSTLEFALRRARLPLALSEGFNPRPRISLAASLAVGHTGEREVMEVILTDAMPVDEVARRLQAALPVGITILDSTDVPIEAKPAAARLRAATYRIDLPVEVPDLDRRVTDLLGQERLTIDETRDGKVRHRDVRPLILSLAAPSRAQLALRVSIEAGSVRPEQVLRLLDIPLEGARIARECIELSE